MPTYITLGNWTDQGVRAAKDAITRAANARQTAQSMGVRVVATYWTLGQYDVVAIVEAPDDETLTRFFVNVGMQGNVRTSTMRAFTEQEMGRVLHGLP